MKLAGKVSKRLRGATLIELLVVTLLVGTVIVSLSAMMSSSVRNRSQAKYREIGTVIAQEGMEVVKRERQRLGWEDFWEEADDRDSDTLCFEASAGSINDLSSSPPCTGIADHGGNSLGTTFQRHVILDVVDSDSVIVTVRVYWEGSYETHGADTNRNTVSVEQTLRRMR